MYRFLLMLLFFPLVCYSQKADTVVVEKAPLVIKQKVYILDTGGRVARKGIGIALIPQQVFASPNAENFHFIKGHGFGLQLLYQKDLYPFRIGFGFGGGFYNSTFTQNTREKVTYSSHVTEIVAWEKYYKLNGKDTVWFYVPETKEVERKEERMETYSETKIASCFYVDVPLSISMIQSFGKWELGAGIEGTLRKNFAGSLPLQSLNAIGNVHVSVGCLVSEHMRLQLSPRFAKDLTATSDQFRNTYLQLAFSSTFFW